MKKIVLLSSLFYIGLIAKAHAFPQFTNMGARSTGTITAINVSTNPTLIVTTGTNVQDEGSGFVWNPSTTPVQGQFMVGRVHMEIFNDTGDDIFIGYNSNVSTLATTPRYGRRISNGAAWSHDCGVKEHWVVSGSSVLYKCIITQER